MRRSLIGSGRWCRPKLPGASTRVGASSSMITCSALMRSWRPVSSTRTYSWPAWVPLPKAITLASAPSCWSRPIIRTCVPLAIRARSSSCLRSSSSRSRAAAAAAALLSASAATLCWCRRSSSSRNLATAPSARPRAASWAAVGTSVSASPGTPRGTEDRRPRGAGAAAGDGGRGGGAPKKAIEKKLSNDSSPHAPSAACGAVLSPPLSPELLPLNVSPSIVSLSGGAGSCLWPQRCDSDEGSASGVSWCERVHSATIWRKWQKSSCHSPAPNLAPRSVCRKLEPLRSTSARVTSFAVLDASAMHMIRAFMLTCSLL